MSKVNRSYKLLFSEICAGNFFCIQIILIPFLETSFLLEKKRQKKAKDLSAIQLYVYIIVPLVNYSLFPH